MNTANPESWISLFNIISMGITAIGGAIAGVWAKSSLAKKSTKNNRGRAETEVLLPIKANGTHKSEICNYGDTVPKLAEDFKVLTKEFHEIKIQLTKVSTTSELTHETLKTIQEDIRDIRNSNNRR